MVECARKTNSREANVRLQYWGDQKKNVTAQKQFSKKTQTIHLTLINEVFLRRNLPYEPTSKSQDLEIGSD